MLVGIALAVVLIAAVVVVLLIVRRRRRVRAEKLAFISDLHAVEADRVCLTLTLFLVSLNLFYSDCKGDPLRRVPIVDWTAVCHWPAIGGIASFRYLSRILNCTPHSLQADADTYMGGPLAETDFGSKCVTLSSLFPYDQPSLPSLASPSTHLSPEPAAMTTTMRPRHTLEGEVDVDAPIVSKAARSAAHTTVVDSRLGLSEEALTELENPLYVSERADGDWSQSFAFGVFHYCIVSTGCILAHSQWACRPATSRPCRPASMPGVVRKSCSDWRSFAVASWPSSARRRRRDAWQKRRACVRRRRKRSGRGRASSRSSTTSEPWHVAPSPRSRSASLFAPSLYIHPSTPVLSHKGPLHPGSAANHSRREQ